MSWGEDFMAEARGQVAARAKSMSHRISTLAWYRGRKELRHAPATALQNVGAFIPLPVVGTLLDRAIGEAFKKVDEKRTRWKKAKYDFYADEKDIESLRKVAKADAKNLKTLAAALDGNQLKLKDAIAGQRSSMLVYVKAVNSGIVSKDQVWKAALAIYERERYEYKILLLVEGARAGLTAIEEYVGKSHNETVKLVDDFSEDLDFIADELIGA